MRLITLLFIKCVNVVIAKLNFIAFILINNVSNLLGFYIKNLGILEYLTTYMQMIIQPDGFHFVFFGKPLDIWILSFKCLPVQWVFVIAHNRHNNTITTTCLTFFSYKTTTITSSFPSFWRIGPQIQIFFSVVTVV